MSESEDMAFESQPQTPTSPEDNHHHFSAISGTEASSISVVREKSPNKSTTHQRSLSRELTGGEDQLRAKEPLKPSSSLPDVVQGFSR